MKHVLILAAFTLLGFVALVAWPALLLLALGKFAWWLVTK